MFTKLRTILNRSQNQIHNVVLTSVGISIVLFSLFKLTLAQSAEGGDGVSPQKFTTNPSTEGFLREKTPNGGDGTGPRK
jgi:hypothetical protein